MSYPTKTYWSEENDRGYETSYTYVDAKHHRVERVGFGHVKVDLSDQISLPRMESHRAEKDGHCACGAYYVGGGSVGYEVLPGYWHPPATTPAAGRG